MYSLFSAVTSLRSNHGTCMFLNQIGPVSIICVQVRLSSLIIISPHDFCSLTDFSYEPIRSLSTELYGFSYENIIGWNMTIYPISIFELLTYLLWIQ